MTLKEKFNIISCKDCDMPYCDIKCTILSDNELDRIEKIADEYAIGFANWIRVCKLKGRPYDFENIKELLIIYKEEKGL